MANQENNRPKKINPEWCKCNNFSCNSSSENTRLRMVKDDQGVITDRVTLDGIEYKGGIVSNDVVNCEIRERIYHKDRYGEYHKELKKIKPGQKKQKVS